MGAATRGAPLRAKPHRHTCGRRINRIGVYQRDDRTLPSALAEAAAEEGWDLVIENFSMVGDVAWLQN